MEAQTHQNHRPEEKPTHQIGLENFTQFVGEWQIEGYYGTEKNQMTGKESFELLDGDFFLINKWDRDFGGKRHTGLGFIGYDTNAGQFLCQSCDNLGYARTYDVRIEEDSFSMTGPHERAQIQISEDRNNIYIFWQINQEGHWSELCNLKGTRIH